MRRFISLFLLVPMLAGFSESQSTADVGCGIKRLEHPVIGMTEIVLENGFKVWLKPTKFEKEEVLVRVIAWGGRDSLPLADQKAAEHAAAVAWESGEGPLCTEKLSVVMYEKMIDFMPRIEKEMRALDASSHQETLPDLLAILSNWFKYSTVSRKGFEAAKEFFPDLAKFKYEKLETCYKDAFKVPSEFTCIIIGDFVLNEELISSIERTLGSIPQVHAPSIYSKDRLEDAFVKQSLLRVQAADPFWWQENVFWESVLGNCALWGCNPTEIASIKGEVFASP